MRMRAVKNERTLVVALVGLSVTSLGHFLEGNTYLSTTANAPAACNLGMKARTAQRIHTVPREISLYVPPS